MLNDVTKMQDELKKRLGEASFAHCQNVADNAGRIAGHYLLDADKLYVSALLHDIATETEDAELLRMARDKGIRISKVEEEKPHKLHGKVGAEMVKDIFGIDDEDILAGIASHYGVPDMTDFEEAVFVADCFDKLCRIGGEPSMDEMLECPNLDAAVLYLVGCYFKINMSGNGHIDPDEEMTFDFILDKIQREFAVNEDVRDWIESRKPTYSDEFFDKLINIHLNHAVPVTSATNMRDLGGYECIYDLDWSVGNETGKRQIKKHKLIRTAYLKDLTKEDAKKLYDMGINYVIDFRGEADQKRMPDQNIELFKHVTCDLSTLSATEHQRDVKGVRKGVDPNKLDAQLWMNAEYLKEFDADKMYRDMYLNDNTKKALRKFFDTLMSDDCTGAIMHCRDGKDRTGTAIALALALLGVSDEDIKLDYMASAIPAFAVTEMVEDYFFYFNYNEEIRNNSRREKSVDMALYDNVTKWMTARYRTVENFLDEVLGMDVNYVKKFRDKFTEDV